MHSAPNPEMPSYALREALFAHVLNWGNAYALIDFDDYTEPKAIWLMRPDRTKLMRDYETRQLYFNYTPMDGSLPVKVPYYRVLHVPGLGFDGLTGYSIISMARDAIGLGLATEKFGALYFGQGTNLGAIAKHPGHLSPEAHDNLKKDLKEKYEGIGKSHSLIILQEGMTFDKTTIPPDDSQFLETRQFQITDIARWYRVPPHMIGDLSKATFSNIEQQSLEYVVYTLTPWLVRWEQWMNFKLIPPQLQATHYFKFIVQALLRGDFASRTNGYHMAIMDGWLSPNEAREFEDLNPRIGGDEYLRPTNMTLASLPPPAPPMPDKPKM